jgi:hypothetical protein
MNDDSDLRERFASLRRAEAASAPNFEWVLGSGRRRFNNAGWRVAVAAGIVSVAVGGVILRVSHPPEAPVALASAPTLAQWRAPTDFLLNTPVQELLHTIPEIGERTSTRLDPLPPIGLTTPMPRAGLEHS